MLTGLLYLTLLQGSNFMFNGTENCQILRTQSKPEQLKSKVHGLFKKKKTEIFANKENPMDEGLLCLQQVHSDVSPLQQISP